MSSPDFIRVSHADPHVRRARQILAAHPEVRALSGPTPSTAIWVVALVDAWTVVNVVVQTVSLTAAVRMVGWGPMKFLAASTVLAIGLHPFGARWIQEHFVFHGEQETYSHYGPLNAVSFNVGDHNEHHDLVTIPWSRLPRLRALAPEFYDPLYAHRSWTRLLVAFIHDRRVTLFSRVVRPASP